MYHHAKRTKALKGHFAAKVKFASASCYLASASYYLASASYYLASASYWSRLGELLISPRRVTDLASASYWSRLGELLISPGWRVVVMCSGVCCGVLCCVVLCCVVRCVLWCGVMCCVVRVRCGVWCVVWCGVWCVACVWCDVWCGVRYGGGVMYGGVVWRGAVWCVVVVRCGAVVVWCMVVVRCGAVWCGVVWWWCGAVRHPSIGQGRQYQSFPGTSPGHSRGTGVTSGTPEHSVGQSSATQQHDKTTQTIGYVNQQSVYCSMKAFCVPTPHTCITV